MTPPEIRKHCRLDRDAESLLENGDGRTRPLGPRPRQDPPRGPHDRRPRRQRRTSQPSISAKPSITARSTGGIGRDRPATCQRDLGDCVWSPLPSWRRGHSRQLDRRTCCMVDEKELLSGSAFWGLARCHRPSDRAVARCARTLVAAPDRRSGMPYDIVPAVLSRLVLDLETFQAAALRLYVRRMKPWTQLTAAFCRLPLLDIDSFAIKRLIRPKCIVRWMTRKPVAWRPKIACLSGRFEWRGDKFADHQHVAIPGDSF